jgi:GNAT superfamily N-acetyltransferase
MTALRGARPTEATLLAGLQERASVAAFAHVFPPDRYPFPRNAVVERWANALEDPEASVVVAEADSDPVGVALVRAEWLDGLYVLPEWWGEGVAGELHDRALQIVRGLGSTRCHLWVLEQNPRARRFYERRGWRENGCTRVVPFPPNPLDVGYTLDF